MSSGFRGTIRDLFGDDRFIMVVTIVWLSLHYWIFGKYSLVLFGDEADGTLLSELMAVSFGNAPSPLWSPLVASGTDRMAMDASPYFMQLLFYILPGWLAYAVIHILMIGGAVGGTYYLARRTFGLDRQAAYFAAFAFAVPFAFATRVQITIALIPLVILAISQLLDNRAQLRYWGLFALAAAGYSLLSAVGYLILFPAIFVGFWFLVVERRFRPSDLGIIALFFIVVYALRFQDIQALLANAPLSNRSLREIASIALEDELLTNIRGIFSGLFNPQTIGTASWPNIFFNYTGIAILLFLLALVANRLRDPMLRRLAWLFATCAVFHISQPAFKNLLVDFIPVIRDMQFNRIWMYTPLVFAVGGGFGVRELQRLADSRGGSKIPRRMIRWLPVLPLVIVLAFSATDKVWNGGILWITQGSYKHNFESPVIRALASRISAAGLPVRVASNRTYESVANVYGLESPGGKVNMYQGRYASFWKALATGPSARTESETFQNRVQGFMAFNHTFDVIDTRAVQSLGEFYNMDLLSLANVKYVLSRHKLNDPQLRLVDDLAPVPERSWSELTKREKLSVNLKANFTGRSHLFVYENIRALPRFFLVKKLRVTGSRKATLNALGKQSAETLRNTVYLESDAVPGGMVDGATFADGTVRLLEYGADAIDLAVSANGPALLVVGNSYSPFWKAFVDGVETPIFPADVTFWGVLLPSGAKKISFRYQPPYLFTN